MSQTHTEPVPDTPAETRSVALIGVAAVAGVAMVFASGALVLVAADNARAPAPAVAAPADEAPAAAAQLSVRLDEFSIQPDPLELSGTTATLVVENVGEAEHDLAIETTGLVSPVVAAGETTTFEVELEPGTYTVFCDLPGHRQAGMEATLVVSAG